MNHQGDVAIEISSRHGHVSPRMEEYATKKAEKLLRFNDQVSRIEVVVDGPHEAPDIEMVVHLDNHDHLVARDRNGHFGAAMDGVAHKMERQLKKLKEKLKHHKGDPSLSGQQH
ncbi:MAG: ribosome-associated translation inhibitor RaiA [Planctomycetota bacterium]